MNRKERTHCIKYVMVYLNSLKKSLKCTTANKLYNIETKEYEQKSDR